MHDRAVGATDDGGLQPTSLGPGDPRDLLRVRLRVTVRVRVRLTLALTLALTRETVSRLVVVFASPAFA